MATIGWIPLLPGIALRNLLYPTIFKRVGRSVKIHPDVELFDASCVEIEDKVTLCRRVYIEMRQENDVYLGPQAYLDRDVRIRCIGYGGKVVLGKRVHLDCGVDIKTHHGGQIEIGDRTYIGPYTCLSGYGNITIGKDCLIASHSSMYAHNYNFSDRLRLIREQGYTYRGIEIEDNCWLGSGVRILDGVTIGQGSVIGAGAVVTKNIPAYSVAVGVPAKVVSRHSSTPQVPLPSPHF